MAPLKKVQKSLSLDTKSYSRQKSHIVVVTKKPPMCQKPNCAGKQKKRSQW